MAISKRQVQVARVCSHIRTHLPSPAHAAAWYFFSLPVSKLCAGVRRCHTFLPLQICDGTFQIPILTAGMQLGYSYTWTYADARPLFARIFARRWFTSTHAAASPLAVASWTSLQQQARVCSPCERVCYQVAACLQCFLITLRYGWCHRWTCSW